MKFANAIKNQPARTLNNMKARQETGKKSVDLFYKFGALRGQDVITPFSAAYGEDRERALRIAQWGRDVRGGAGERDLFRNVIRWLAVNHPEDAKILLAKAPLVGRWDDVIEFLDTPTLTTTVIDLVKTGLDNKDRLCAKWMPRKGHKAAVFTKALGLTPRQYRKLIVGLTDVVETKMCAKDWESINFSHVPSQAARIYRKAFFKQSKSYVDYINALKIGDKSVKVNASATYPYEVLKPFFGYPGPTSADVELASAQWEALPNYVGDAPVLAMVDVSGSMGTKLKGSTVTAMQVAISLGLYTADKNRGPFKDCFLTFSTYTKLQVLTGSIRDKVSQLSSADWAMSTDVIKAFRTILKTAKDNSVSDDDMPKVLLILSDMQFNQCARFDDSAMESIRRQYTEAGYTVPKIVFWNLVSYDNVPVSENEQGVALVSGFSPSVMKNVLKMGSENYTPESVMLDVIMNPKYDI